MEGVVVQAIGFKLIAPVLVSPDDTGNFLCWFCEPESVGGSKPRTTGHVCSGTSISGLGGNYYHDNDWPCCMLCARSVTGDAAEGSASGICPYCQTGVLPVPFRDGVDSEQYYRKHGTNCQSFQHAAMECDSDVPSC